ncbi:pentapeptide repeat-containing protein [Rufibacter immobilis]|uniref:Pentapeptide repeat-containing protein n=1 Tax=Rufibacter immobilis TaxID=1348778 RepID=A0A3M9N3T0_9BACT|nr:pentapeptide repeat-containing protein [Rufibacter immobilis]RNI32461.1 pentapeptide repeat-containing protein [Rufibacter immobilis]
MQELLHENKVFEGITYAGKGISGREFDGCTFKHCDFANSDLSGNSFSECVFDNCNLSMAKLNGSKLQDVTFTNCKLMGVDFSGCHDFLFSVAFKGCTLDYTFFGKKNLKKTLFHSCSIKEANFTDTDLTQATFAQCDLLRTVFERTNLEKADLLTAYNYAFDPEKNRVKKLKISAQGALGLLAKYDLVVK